MNNSCRADVGFTIFYNKYLTPAINLLGISLNLICILIFIEIINKKKRDIPSSSYNQSNLMFDYLLIKSVYDFVKFVISFFQIFFNVNYIAYSYAFQIWYIWGHYYGELVLELCSGFIEIAATFDVLITFNKRFYFLQKKKAFYYVLVLTLLYSAIFYIYILFEFDIVLKQFAKHSFNATSNTTNQIIVEGYISESKFQKYLSFRILSYLHSFQRDFLIIIILIILNCLILKSLRQLTLEKKRLSMVSCPNNRSRNNSNERSSIDHLRSSIAQPTINPMITNAKNAEFNKVAFIFFYLFLSFNLV
jgi:hypothetical protein